MRGRYAAHSFDQPAVGRSARARPARKARKVGCAPPPGATLRRVGVLVVAVALSGLASGAHALDDAPSRRVYAPYWMKPLARRHPCLLSLAAPPSESESCLPWTRRETASPAFDRATGLLVVGGADGMLRGWSSADGSEVYQRELPGELVSRPAVAGASVFFGTTEARVMRVRLSDGETEWQSEVDAEVVAPVRVTEDTVYVVTGLETLYAFERDTGALRWLVKHPLPPGITLRGQAAPLVLSLRVRDENVLRVFVGHASGKLSVIDARSGRAVTDATLAEGEEFLDLDADPLLHRGNLIAASHATGVFALDPVTLAPRWRFQESGIVRLASGGPGRVIAAGAGKVIGLDADTGVERWRFSFARGAPTQPVLYQDRVHVGSDRGSLYVLDATTGEPQQVFGSGHGFAATPELGAGMLFAVSAPGTLHALSQEFAGIVQRGPP